MINYLDIGEKDKDVIVFIHGLGNKPSVWERQFELSEYYRLIILELRGHNESTLTDNLNVETFADDIIELLDYLKLDKVNLCGISLGALTVLELYKRYSDRVKSLTLVNTTFYIPSLIGDQIIKEKERAIAKHGYYGYAQLTMEKCIHNMEFDDELVDKCFKIRPDTYIEASKSAFGRNYLMELPKINVPTLIIGSNNDKVTPVFNAYIFNNMIRCSKLKIFDKCGHLSNVEKWEEFNKEVHNHIANVD